MFNKTPKRSKSVRGSGALPAAAAELVLQWDRGCWWVQSPRRVTPLGPFIMSKTRKVANRLAHHQPAATRPWAGPGGVTRLGLCAHQRPRPSYSTTSAKRCGQFVIFSGFLHDEPGATLRWAEPGGVIHLRLCADHRPRPSYSTTFAKRRIGRLLGCRHARLAHALRGFSNIFGHEEPTGQPSLGQDQATLSVLGPATNIHDPPAAPPPPKVQLADCLVVVTGRLPHAARGVVVLSRFGHDKPRLIFPWVYRARRGYLASAHPPTFTTFLRHHLHQNSKLIAAAAAAAAVLWN